MPKAAPGSNITVSPWLVALVVSMATFMEVMDTSIANVALLHIAGGLAAGRSEATWVLTSYLVSNAIILPISGWLASVIGRKRFYMGCVMLFTVSSFLCGIAPNLPMLLFFRVLQGIGGGGLAPSEQSILTDTFPAAQRGQAFALYGVAVVVAPAIGPALGGWITDTYSWRWIFFINIPVGIVSLILTHIFVQDSESAKKEQKDTLKGGLKIDYMGFGLVALGLGCLQVVLDKGQEDDWFGSNFIVAMMILAAIGILGAIVWELFITDHPIVDLPLYKDVGFFSVNLVMFATFFILLSTTQLLPQYVQSLLGYDATSAGLILMPGGLCIMALMPVVGFLVNRVQPKYLVAFGLLAMSLAMEYMTNFNLQLSFRAVATARAFQAISLAFLFVPINTMAYAKLPPGKSNNASALVNLMRNLGGSVGVSVATTMLDRRSQVHQNRLIETVTPYNRAYQQTVDATARGMMAHGATPGSAAHQAAASVYGLVQGQATLLSYLDVFKTLSIAALCMVGLVFFLKSIKLGAGGAHGH